MVKIRVLEDDVKALLWCATVVALAAVTMGAQVPKDALALGGNINERFQWATPAVLDQTHATWVRGFFPASEFMSGARSYEHDEGLAALKTAAATGHKVVLSLKWDSVGRGGFGRVPKPGSAEEAKAFAFVDQLLDATARHVAVLVVVNELTIDTEKEDLQPDAAGKIPMITFLQRVTAHVDAENRKASDGGKLPIFAGGMTRMDQAKQQMLPVNVAMIQWVNDDARIAGCDFHAHEPDMATTRAALEYMHREVQKKPLMISEFSLVWKWQQHFGDALDASDAGKAFAAKYGLPHGMTVAQFCSAAFEHPVPEKEWESFLAAQPWFEPHYLSDVATMMEANGVRVATYALVWDPKPVPHAISLTAAPWFLNQVLVPGMAESPDPKRLPENYGFFADFTAWQTR